MKQRIKLTEDDLNRIIHKCLNEAYFYPKGVKTFVSCIEDFLANVEDILDNLENECEDGDEALKQIINIGNSLFDTIYNTKEEIKDIAHLQPIEHYKD